MPGPIQRLYILYDPACGLCTRIQTWLVRQPAYIALHPIAAGSDAAMRLFPALPQSEKSDEVIVISDNGGVYFGDHAWLMCLYALRNYREFSRRIASPRLLPLARQAFTLISRNRHSISKWLRLLPEEEVRRRLNDVIAPRCVR